MPRFFDIVNICYEDLGFRFVAGGLHPDHDTIANFRKAFLSELQGMFVQILLLAQLSGVSKLGNLSLDGRKIHAEASKSKAVSYGRLKELEMTLREEVGRLFELGERADQGEVQLPKERYENSPARKIAQRWLPTLSLKRQYFRKSCEKEAIFRQ